MTTVKVYSTPSCPWCQKLKAWLDEKGVEYENIDVSQNQEAMQEIIEKSGQMGVPQTEINGKVIVGFDQEAIEAELGNSGDQMKKAA